MIISEQKLRNLIRKLINEGGKCCGIEPMHDVLDQDPEINAMLNAHPGLRSIWNHEEKEEKFQNRKIAYINYKKDMMITIDDQEISLTEHCATRENIGFQEAEHLLKNHDFFHNYLMDFLRNKNVTHVQNMYEKAQRNGPKILMPNGDLETIDEFDNSF